MALFRLFFLTVLSRLACCCEANGTNHDVFEFKSGLSGMKGEEKYILVAGGAGYIGSHMVRLLIEKGYPVIVLDNLSTGHKGLLTGGTFIEGSLGDRDLLETIFSTYAIDAVMHFAAFSQVGESVLKPAKYYRNNVAGTVALVDTMVRHDVRRFIFSSSAAVYGEPERIPIDENHPCAPNSPYGDTKLAVERMLAHYDAAYGLKSICLRYFNAAGAHPAGLIGERHDPETHLIPLVLKAALTASPIKIFGTDYPTEDGTCVRDYVHVCDLANAHLLALNALRENSGTDIFNLGNSVGHSVRQVVELGRIITGLPIEAIECERRSGDPGVLIAGSGKARRVLGWKPEFEKLEQIMETAWQWHRTQK